MNKLDKDALLQGVKTIITEGYSNSGDDAIIDGTTKFNIRKYIYDLVEEGYKNPKLMNYIHGYEEALESGEPDYKLFESFGRGLLRFEKANNKVKKIIKKMNETLANDGMSLMGFKLIDRLRDVDVKEKVTKSFNVYIQDKCKQTKDILVEELQTSIMNNDPAAVELNLLLTEDSNISPNFIHSDYITEAEEALFEKELQEKRDKKKADDIFEKVKRYLDEQFNEYEKAKLTEKEEYCLDAIANKQGLNLYGHISDIRSSHIAAANEKLQNVLEQYSSAIQQGAYEERLYETFLYNLSKFNYILPVDKVIKSINEKVSERKEQITLTKLLEEMRDDHTSFIYVDLIQEDVARYVKEPNATNRVQLRNALMPYASDPYINEMFNVIYSDNSKRANELQEKVINIKDQIKLIRENASIYNIYTPVQYIKENECIFNVRGQFYIKKGNNIIELDESLIDKLDDRFVDLCRLVNDPHVTINEDNTITLKANNKEATIYEGCVNIYGHRETKNSLRNLREMCIKYDDYDTNFYIMCSCLLENFNDIAKIDWAKHIVLNENSNIHADLFKLDNNIFMTVHNDSLNQHTFYSNVNPIFCKNKLNEHMGINVSSLFADLLPSQDKILLKLNETKNQYEDSISQYEDMIQKMKDALETTSDENKKKLETAIKDAEDKLDDIKSEYKNWQKETEKLTGVDSENDEEDGVYKEEPNTPLDDDEVEQMKDEFTQPLQSEDDNSFVETGYETDDKETELSDDELENSDENISDEDFDEILGEEPEEHDSEELDPEVFDVDDEESSDEDDLSDDEENSDEDDLSDDEESSDEDDELEDSDDDEEDIEDAEEFAEVDLDSDTEEPVENDDDKYEINKLTDDTLSDEDVYGEDDEYKYIPDKEETELSDDELENSEEEYDGSAATDIFGGDVNNPVKEPVEYEEPRMSSPVTSFSYKIADVMFDENIKEGTKQKSGSVIVIVPMVDGTGKTYVDNKTIDFYINDDNLPILDNEPMTSEMYTAVIDAIKSHPDYKVVCNVGETATDTLPSVAAFKSNKEEDEDWESNFLDDEDGDDWEAEYIKNGNEEDRGYYGLNDEPSDDEPSDDEVESDLDDDEFERDLDDDDDDDDDDVQGDVYSQFGFSKEDFEDDDKDDEIIVPTYKSGDTDIEFPASNVDDTIIPESRSYRKGKALKEHRLIKIKPIFKNKSNKSSKRFF